MPPTDRNTLVFKLSVTCTRKAGANKDSKDLDEVFSNHLVTSGMLEWVPQGEQAQIPLFQVSSLYKFLLHVLPGCWSTLPLRK